MTDRSDLLTRECLVFTRYLLGIAASAEIVASYRRAHEVSRVDRADSRMDVALVRCARSGPAWTRLADAYAGVFAASGSLRRKLVLLVAILESRPETADDLDLADGTTRTRALLRAFGAATRWLLTLGLAMLVVPFVFAWPQRRQ